MKKNNKGFTLIELLVAIVIVLSVMSVAIIAISKISKSKKEEAFESVKEQVVTAAQSYYSSNEYRFEGFNDNSKEIYIPISALVKDDYLNLLTNPKTGKKINECDRVKIKNNNGKKYFEYIENTNGDSCNLGDSLAYALILPNKEKVEVSMSYDKSINKNEKNEFWINAKSEKKVILTANLSNKNFALETLRYCKSSNEPVLTNFDFDSVQNVCDADSKITLYSYDGKTSLQTLESQYLKQDTSEDDDSVKIEDIERKSDSDKKREYDINLTDEMKQEYIIACVDYGKGDVCGSIKVGVDTISPSYEFKTGDNYTNSSSSFIQGTNVNYNISCIDETSGCLDSKKELSGSFISSKDQFIKDTSLIDNAGNETKPLQYTCLKRDSENLDLLLLVDTSGSMSGINQRMSKLRKSLRKTIENLSTSENNVNINISIDTFAGGAFYIPNGGIVFETLDYTRLKGNEEKILKKIDGLISLGILGIGGATNTYTAMNRANKIVENRRKDYKNNKQVVMLLTDGLPGLVLFSALNTKLPLLIENKAINETLEAAEKLKNNDVLVYVLGADKNLSNSPEYNYAPNGLSKWRDSNYKLRLRETMILLNILSSNWKYNGNKYEPKFLWETLDSSKNDRRWQLIPNQFTRNSEIVGHGFLYGINDSDSEDMARSISEAINNSMEVGNSCDK